MEVNVILANYIEIINPMTHSKELFDKWVDNYPFFNNIEKEGVVLYAA
ncbi:hypothetical protein [Pseudobutyrivibrio sp.]|nr:hypothetical protein [Pseudobutyrivibrio sp.]